MVSEGKSIIFFDSDCLLCNSSVQFIIRYDQHERFLFSPLQSEAGINLLQQYGFKPDLNGSFILLHNNKLYTQSSAALTIAKHLSGWVRYTYLFIIVPKFVRDFAYQVIAKNRYKWFGKKEECLLPSPELKKRFIR